VRLVLVLFCWSAEQLTGFDAARHSIASRERAVVVKPDTDASGYPFYILLHCATHTRLNHATKYIAHRSVMAQVEKNRAGDWENKV
jgi:hypothetical protein